MMPSFTCVSPAQLACQTRITPSTVCVGAALNVPVRCHQRQGHRAIGRTQLEQDSWSSDLGAYLHLSRRAGEVNRGARWSLIAKRQREAGVLFDRLCRTRQPVSTARSPLNGYGCSGGKLSALGFSSDRIISKSCNGLLRTLLRSRQRKFLE